MIVVAPTASSEQDEQLLQRVSVQDRVARWSVASALMLLLVAAGDPLLPLLAENGLRVLGTLPRLIAFFVVMLQALILHGGSSSRASRFELACGCALSGFLALELLESGSATRDASTFTVYCAARVTAQSLCFISAGLLLARWISSAGDMLALLACLVAADIWLNSKFVPDRAGPDHPLSLLRLAWPVLHPRLVPAPALPEILALTALIASARRLNLPLAAMLIGLLSGYFAATFLGLASQPSWPKLSTLLVTSGALIACWPDLEIGVRDLVRAMLLAFSLMLALSLLSAIKQERELPPRPRETLWDRSAI